MPTNTENIPRQRRISLSVNDPALIRSDKEPPPTKSSLFLNLSSLPLSSYGLVRFKCVHIINSEIPFTISAQGFDIERPEMLVESLKASTPCS
ncbi:predicted protein [Botrytis cinerea T4]|uniref:Uncharacterized protein n=1 Tax=Botryotinia fuckeliana (strain T4) TaxID=999810 RepID=G2YEJ8_BOTF4|nr:predicted protein [Botrytis cinerea T4]